ncbi:MAG: PQQ-binding-like beta-propeller repeat protein [Pirellulales bacterium]
MSLATVFRRSLALALACAATVSLAADWPQFRGPAGNGVAADKQAPTAWSETENIAWKAALPHPGNGSPIVVDGRVLLTCAEDAEGLKRSLYCFDRQDGKQQWVRTIDFGKAEPTHNTNPFCGGTPASDGKRVVSWFGSAGLHCYDLEGKELWQRDLGEFKHMWGDGSSPIFYDGKVVLHSGPGKQIFVAMFDADSGSTLWQTDEPLPVPGNSDHNEKDGYLGSWATPVVAKAAGQDQIICALPGRVNAYDPRNGNILWSCQGLRHGGGDLAYSSPIIAGDVCFQTGGYGGPAFSVRLGGEGDVTDTQRLFRREKEPQSIGTGIVHDGLIYRPNAGPGTIDCIEPATGKVLWRERATDGAFWGSMVLVGDLAYVTSQQGVTVVFRPNADKYDEVAANPLGESCNATPAVSDGQIFIRTGKHLVCVGKQ